MKNLYPVADALLYQIEVHGNTDVKMKNTDTNTIKKVFNFLKSQGFIMYDEISFDDSIPHEKTLTLSLEGAWALRLGIKRYMRRKKLSRIGKTALFVFLIITAIVVFINNMLALLK